MILMEENVYDSVLEQLQFSIIQVSGQVKIAILEKL